MRMRIFGRAEPPGSIVNHTTRVHEHSVCGRVLEVALVKGGREIHFAHELLRINKEWAQQVVRHRPQRLVFNLLGVKPPFGNELTGMLVSGLLTMPRPDIGSNVSVVASGQTAAELSHWLKIGKIDMMFGGIYAELESAITKPICIQSTLSGWNDEDILRRLHGADQSAMEAAYDCLAPRLYKSVLKDWYVQGQHGTAANVVLQVMLRLWREPYIFEEARQQQPPGHRYGFDLRRWSEMHAGKEALKHARYAPYLGHDDTVDSERQTVFDRLQQLPPAQHSAFQAVFFERQPVQIVAAKTSETGDAIRNDLRAALTALAGSPLAFSHPEMADWELSVLDAIPMTEDSPAEQHMQRCESCSHQWQLVQRPMRVIAYATPPDPPRWLREEVLWAVGEDARGTAAGPKPN